MRREGQVARPGTDRTALVPVWLDRAVHQQAHGASHSCALMWNELAQWLRTYWVEYEIDPGIKQIRDHARHLRDSNEGFQMLHSHSIQGIVDDLKDAVATYRSNKKLGLDGRAPWRLKKYRPVSFTRNFGWRVTPEGKLALSYGRGRERIVLPAPVFTDPLTNADGEIRPGLDPNLVRVTYQRAVPNKARPAVEAHEQGPTRAERASGVTSRTSTPQAA